MVLKQVELLVLKIVLKAVQSYEKRKLARIPSYATTVGKEIVAVVVDMHVASLVTVHIIGLKIPQKNFCIFFLDFLNGKP
jgi:hypothetical protein